MNKKTSEDYHMQSDTYVKESGVQGGKILGENLALFAFAIGIPLFAIGIVSIFYTLFITGFPEDWPIILYIFSPQSLAVIIGLLAIIGGYTIYRAKHVKN